MSFKINRLFCLKTIAFLALSFCFLINNAQAQVTDTLNQKPQLNNGMPPAIINQPVIVTPPSQVVTTDTVRKEKVKIKEKKPGLDVPFRKKLFTGGSFGLSFGDFTNIQVSPILGYRLTDRVSAGLGFSYMYIGNSFESVSIGGGKVFAQAMVYNDFFAHAEYERFSGLDFTYTSDALLAGVGYRQMASDRVGFDIMLLLDLNQNQNSFYTNPIIRGGLIINLY